MLRACHWWVMGSSRTDFGKGVAVAVGTGVGVQVDVAVGVVVDVSVGVTVGVGGGVAVVVGVAVAVDVAAAVSVGGKDVGVTVGSALPQPATRPSAMIVMATAT